MLVLGHSSWTKNVGQTSVKNQGFNWSLSEAPGTRPRVSPREGEGTLERVMGDSIGQWHGDRRVNEASLRSRMLPSKLDLALHLVLD